MIFTTHQRDGAGGTKRGSHRRRTAVAWEDLNGGDSYSRRVCQNVKPLHKFRSYFVMLLHGRYTYTLCSAPSLESVKYVSLFVFFSGTFDARGLLRDRKSRERKKKYTTLKPVVTGKSAFAATRVLPFLLLSLFISAQCRATYTHINMYACKCGMNIRVRAGAREREVFRCSFMDDAAYFPGRKSYTFVLIKFYRPHTSRFDRSRG